jgi:flavin-dependent dehydrogenase
MRNAIRTTGERTIRIVGGGPAGSAAAIAARSYGADVQIIEKSSVAHHRVCGEFISAEACQLLEPLGAWDPFQDLRPARATRCCLRFGSRVKQWSLSEPAFGLSRLELDRLLLDRAAASGARISHGERWQPAEQEIGTALIMTPGRSGRTSKPGRLFGFKSHFDGPTDDAVELFFGASSYVGISTVENGITNVCGMASEANLRRYGFDFDDFVVSNPVLAERLKPLRRRMPWLSTGPLVFSNVQCESLREDVYVAGDALGFIDPFTGSGILNALLTGRRAGVAAAEGLTRAAYVGACRKLMRRPYAMSAMFRTLLDWGCAGSLAAFLPGDWIYRLTRAAVPNAL